MESSFNIISPIKSNKSFYNQPADWLEWRKCLGYGRGWLIGMMSVDGWIFIYLSDMNEKYFIFLWVVYYKDD